jgi:flagellar L-ring protein precursor FlgH
MKRVFTVGLLLPLSAVAGCESFADGGLREPQFTSPGTSQFENAGAARSIDPPEFVSPGGLWRSGPQSLFGDRRARAVGDVITVFVEIDDQAELRNRTERRRDASEEVSVPALFGLNSLAQRVLPDGAGLDPAIDASTASQSNGDGAVRRRERITLRIAAAVTDVLPNGNLVIRGSQEVRVNQELRDLRVEGVIRREDITRANFIGYDKIAEARISYGGRGDISRANRTRYGQTLIDLLSPF